jgi:hypothetical protein
MKLPDKIWVWKNITLDTMYTEKWRGPVPEYVKVYVPASEAEALRERVKELEGALDTIGKGSGRYSAGALAQVAREAIGARK